MRLGSLRVKDFNISCKFRSLFARAAFGNLRVHSSVMQLFYQIASLVVYNFALTAADGSAEIMRGAQIFLLK